MAIFSKKTRGILHVSKNEVTLIDLDTGGKTSFSFTEDIIQNLEITNQNALIQRVKTLNEKSNTKHGTLIMVLSDDFLFSKSFANIHPEDLKRETEKFITEIPFEREKIVNKSFSLGGNTLVIATNKTLFNALIDAFKIYGWEICHVVPATIFAMLGEGKQTNTFNLLEADKFLYENPELINKINFADLCDVKPGESKPNMFKKLAGALGIIVVVVALAGAGYLLKTKYLDNKTQKQVNENEQTQSSESTQSEPNIITPQTNQEISPTPSVEEKSADQSIYKLVILNGSGIPGLASSTQTEIANLGFLDENIEIGNTEASQNTILEYIPGTNILIIDNLKTFLEGKYATVILTENPQVENEEYDIKIILGEERNFSELETEN